LKHFQAVDELREEDEDIVHCEGVAWISLMIDGERVDTSECCLDEYPLDNEDDELSRRLNNC